MLLRRKRYRHGIYKSSEVSRILGIHISTLYRMLFSKRIAEPMRDDTNRYRIWTDQDLEVLRETLKRD